MTALRPPRTTCQLCGFPLDDVQGRGTHPLCDPTPDPSTPQADMPTGRPHLRVVPSGRTARDPQLAYPAPRPVRRRNTANR